MRSNISFMVLLCAITFGFSQKINTEVQSKNQAPYLLGEINRNGLQSPNYSWFQKNYDKYSPQVTIIQELSSELNQYELVLFMGTWCGDSKREVPRIYKILDACNYPETQLKVVALSKSAELYKQSPQHEEAGLNIHRVPTLIVYKNGKEINRIVEEPVESLEQDLFHIISGNTYESHYAVVAAVDQHLSKSIKKLKRKEQQLLKNYKTKVSSIYELNTYAKVLSYSKASEKAIAVLELNTKFFPEEPQVYLNLYKALDQNQRSTEALLALEKAAELDPKNTKLQAQLKALKSK